MSATPNSTHDTNIGSNPGVSAISSAVSLFLDTAFYTTFGRGSETAVYSGSGSMPAASSSGNGTLAVTGGSYVTAPDGYHAIYDGTSGTLDMTKTTSPASVFMAPDANVVLGSASDTIHADSGNVSITGGSGDTTLLGSSANLTFIGGSGSVTATAAAGNAVLHGSTQGTTTLTGGGPGNDTLYAGTGSGKSVLIGGTSHTTEFGGGSGPTTFYAEGGETTIAGQFGTGDETFFTPQGFESAMDPTLIALNDATDQVIGGSGKTTIIAGTGKDIFGFLNGHAGGTEAIYGLKSSDSLVFGGYTGSAIASENVLGGSDVITLTDHTVITLVGVGHTLFT